MNKINLQAYFATIKKKTGKTPADFKQLAEQKGFVINGVIKPGLKAAEVIAWVKQDFDLGHGHGLAIYHSIQSVGQ
jgi:hypothetical protein